MMSNRSNYIYLLIFQQIGVASYSRKVNLLQYIFSMSSQTQCCSRDLCFCSMMMMMIAHALGNKENADDCRDETKGKEKQVV